MLKRSRLRRVQEGHALPLVGRGFLVTGGSIHEKDIRPRYTGVAVGDRLGPCLWLAVQFPVRRQLLFRGKQRSRTAGRPVVSVLAARSALRRAGADRLSVLAFAASAAADNLRRPGGPAAARLR